MTTRTSQPTGGVLLLSEMKEFASFPKATTFGNHLCPPNADAIIRALAPVIPDRVTAGWNNLLCSLTTGLDPETREIGRAHV